MIAYIDTNVMLSHLYRAQGPLPVSKDITWVTSAISRTEIARSLRRDGYEGDVVPLTREILGAVITVSVNDQVIDTAGALSTRYLKSLDAIHVASALITRCEVVLTRDRQMARACQELGLPVA